MQPQPFTITAIRPKGWAAFLKQILTSHHEVEEVALGVVGASHEGGLAVMGIYLSVFTPIERLRALRLELERLLPCRLRFEVIFARRGAEQRSRLAALLAEQGAVLYRRPVPGAGQKASHRSAGGGALAYARPA